MRRSARSSFPTSGLAAASPTVRDSRGDLGPQDLLNAALRHGAAVASRRWPGTGLAALTADLPALRPAELATALRAAEAARRAGRAAFVPDAAGVGTTMYAVPPGGDFLPLFGGASRARHAASGAAEIDLDDMAGLRRDVDTPEDLRARSSRSGRARGPPRFAASSSLTSSGSDPHHRAGQRPRNAFDGLNLRRDQLAELVHVLGAARTMTS